ncbi:MAG TPA: hypothetical protein VIM69_02265 [Opitutaceae bacterium]
MKKNIILYLSLLLNAALLARVAVRQEAKSEVSSPAIIRGQAIEPVSARAPAKLTTAGGPELRAQLIDELRSRGVPENVLARFALTDIEESWAGRYDACRGDQNKLAAIQLQHDMGLDAEMRQALGEDGFRRWDQANMLREAMLGSHIQLSASEANAIYDAKKALQRRQWELDQARQNGAMDDTQVAAASAKAYSDFGEQMKVAMGEARYAQAMRGDDGSSALKESLAKVNASPSQADQLLAFSQQLADRRAALDKEFQSDPSSELYAQRIKTLDVEQEQGYRRVLGDGVFDAMQKEQDGSYMKMKKFGSTWGLDDSKIDSIYGAIKYYQKQVNDYQDQAHLMEAQGQRVDWDAVSQKLQQFAQSTQTELQKNLGQEKFDHMQQNGVFPFSQPQPAHAAPAN